MRSVLRKKKKKHKKEKEKAAAAAIAPQPLLLRRVALVVVFQDAHLGTSTGAPTSARA